MAGAGEAVSMKLLASCRILGLEGHSPGSQEGNIDTSISDVDVLINSYINMYRYVSIYLSIISLLSIHHLFLLPELSQESILTHPNPKLKQWGILKNLVRSLHTDKAPQSNL